MASRRRSRRSRRQLPVEPLTANDRFFDAMIRHQIGLLRVSSGIRSQVLKLLDKTETDVRRAIRDRLGRAGLESPAQVARLQGLLDELEAIRGAAWDQAAAIWQSEMTALAAAEPKFVDGILKTVVPVQLKTKLPDADRLRAIVTSSPFEGRTMRQWAASIRASDITRIQDQIRIGLVQGESLPAIARRVVGSAKLKGVDGVTQITRRNAETITRTAVNHIANQARRTYFKGNADLVDVELYIATLDAATTRICSSLDGETFELGEGPIPPLHMACRSLRTALLDAEALGKRPMKPVTERMLVREFAKQNGLGRVAGQRRKNLPFGTKGKFDEFARRRTRELIGRVPAKVSYQVWLTRQSAMFQNDVLGATRGRLFRRGGLTLDRFVNRAGDELSLADLARTEAEAFRRAGLDPADFLRAAA